MIFRTPWNAFPDVAVQTTVGKLKSHPDYDAAKAGDQDAALRVIDRVFKPGKVTDSCDLIVPVLQLDQGKQNMLMAELHYLVASFLDTASIGFHLVE